MNERHRAICGDPLRLEQAIDALLRADVAIAAVQVDSLAPNLVADPLQREDFAAAVRAVERLNKRVGRLAVAAGLNPIAS